jgi:hypothetical protein
MSSLRLSLQKNNVMVKSRRKEKIGSFSARNPRRPSRMGYLRLLKRPL